MKQAPVSRRDGNSAMSSVRLWPAAALTICIGGPAIADGEISGLKVPMQCSGNEPSWALIINDAKTATYVWDNQPTTWKVREVGHATGRPTTWRVRFAGTNRQAFIFDEGTQSCSDDDG